MKKSTVALEILNFLKRNFHSELSYSANPGWFFKVFLFMKIMKVFLCDELFIQQINVPC